MSTLTSRIFSHERISWMVLNFLQTDIQKTILSYWFWTYQIKGFQSQDISSISRLSYFHLTDHSFISGFITSSWKLSIQRKGLIFWSASASILSFIDAISKDCGLILTKILWNYAHLLSHFPYFQTMPNIKRVLIYVIPVTLFSFALNIPKFMEVSSSYSKILNKDRSKPCLFTFFHRLAQAENKCKQMDFERSL